MYGAQFVYVGKKTQDRDEVNFTKNANAWFVAQEHMKEHLRSTSLNEL